MPHVIYHPKQSAPRILRETNLWIESQSDVRKKMTVTISRMVGATLILIGLCGLFMTIPFGLHLSVMHSLLVLSAGVLLVYNWYTYNSNASFYTCLGFGILFALFSVAGFVFGESGFIALQTGFKTYDPYVLNFIPGFNTLGRMDHVFHGVLSLVLLIGAYDWHNTHLREVNPERV